MTSFKLQLCVWELTRRCNFSCAYCGSRAGIAHQNELGVDDCLGIARQLVDMGCRRVVLIGGEVFLKQGWHQIAQYLVDHDRDVSIITNGYLINDSIVDQLCDCGVNHIAISIDGDRAVHDEFRMAGSFDRAISAIRLLKSRGFVVSVISTLNSKSVATIGALYDRLKPLGIDAWQLQCCSPFGNASDKRFLVPSRRDLLDVCAFVARENQLADFDITIADNIGYHTDLEPKIRGRVVGGYTGCSAGLSTIGIDSVGNVRGCESMYDDAFVEGNLRTTALADIWHSPTAFAYNRGFTSDMLHGKCATCTSWHKCAAGCRSFNYFYNNDMYESKVCLL